LRGPDPISYAILNGDPETGVSMMLIVEALDEGPLLAQAATKIPPDATSLTLTDQLIDLSHQLIVKNLPAYLEGKLTPYPQPNTPPSYSKKLHRADSQLDWSKSAEQLEREVRAFIIWPRSRAALHGHSVIITKAHALPGQGEIGQIWRDNHELGIFTNEGIFVIDKLIPLGKKEMDAKAFLAGYHI
jgi:methionyl-tRNA formyltransferase